MRKSAQSWGLDYAVEIFYGNFLVFLQRACEGSSLHEECEAQEDDLSAQEP